MQITFFFNISVFNRLIFFFKQGKKRIWKHLSVLLNFANLKRKEKSLPCGKLKISFLNACRKIKNLIFFLKRLAGKLKILIMLIRKLKISFFKPLTILIYALFY